MTRVRTGRQDHQEFHPQIASGAGGRFALAGAKCERQLPARYGPAPEVPHTGRSRHRLVNVRAGRCVPVTTQREGHR